MACGPPGSSVHGILQARILEWIAISLSRGILWIQEFNPGLLHYRQTLHQLSYEGSPNVMIGTEQMDEWVNELMNESNLVLEQI